MAKVFSRYDKREIFNPEISHLFPTVTDTLGFIPSAQRIRELERSGAVLEYMRLVKSVSEGDWKPDGSDAEDIEITSFDSKLDVYDKLEVLKERIRTRQAERANVVKQATTERKEEPVENVEASTAEATE